MSMRFFIVLTSMVFALSLHAQNFNPFPHDYTSQYTYAGGDSLYILTVDSVSDNQSYFNPTFEMDDILTESPTPVIDSNNIFGQKLVSLAEGKFVFVSKEKDSVFIDPYAPLNTDFKFRTDIQARIISREKEPILGASDSVITIELSTGHNIRISENFGFVETYRFEDLGKPGSQPFLLSSIPELDLGEYFYDPFNLFNYEVGDVLGYHEYSDSYNVFPSFWGEKHRVLVVMEKQIYSDSIVYVFEQKVRTYEDFIIQNDSLIIKDVKTVIYKKDSEIIPSFYAFDSELFNPGGYISINKGIGKSVLGVYSSSNYGAFIFGMEGFSQILDYGTFTEFSSGLGVTIDDEYGFSNTYNYLTCFTKASSSYEDCLELSDIVLNNDDLTRQGSKLLVGPNPAYNFISFSDNVKRDCRVLDVTGALVMETFDEASIDIRQLEPGIYMLVYFSSDNIYKHRFIKL